MTEHTYPSNYAPGRDLTMDEIWQWFDMIKPGVIPPDVRNFLAGCWRGHIIRHRAYAREQVLQWFDERAPELARVYRERERFAAPCRGDEP